MRIYYCSAVVMLLWYIVAIPASLLLFTPSWVSDFVSMPAFIIITLLVSIALVRPFYLSPPSPHRTTTRMKEVWHTFGIFMIFVGHVISGAFLYYLLVAPFAAVLILGVLILPAMFSYLLGLIFARSIGDSFTTI